MKKIAFILVPVLVFLLVLSKQNITFFKNTESAIDIQHIEKKGVLKVALNKNPSDYFLYKGEPMGFQLEILEDLCSYMGLKIEVVVCNDPTEMIESLQRGTCDMVAGSWNYSNSAFKDASTSISLLESDLILVQRRLNNEILIKSIDQLKGSTVYVPYLSRQSDVMNDYSKTIQMVQMPQYSQERLIELVANGTIDYTICNSIQSESLRIGYPVLDFQTVVEKEQPIKWIFRNNSVELSQRVNIWLESYKKSTRFSVLLDKYYNSNNKWASTRNRYYAISDKQISEYDDLIKKYSAELNWDWRLLASLICQESRFKPNVKSPVGAFGLMQLMPSTLERFGIDSTATPEQQIKAGVKFLKFLDKSLSKKVFDESERIHFILASYNVGPGHIYDAQRLATKLGKDPQKWFDNVDTCLLSKSNPDNYNEPNIEFGYCKGTETYSFVQEVINRYLHYKNVIPL